MNKINLVALIIISVNLYGCDECNKRLEINCYKECNEFEQIQEVCSYDHYNQQTCNTFQTLQTKNVVHDMNLLASKECINGVISLKEKASITECLNFINGIDFENNLNHIRIPLDLVDWNMMLINDCDFDKMLEEIGCKEVAIDGDILRCERMSTTSQ